MFRKGQNREALNALLNANNATHCVTLAFGKNHMS
jgi:hypothetical protein